MKVKCIKAEYVVISTRFIILVERGNVANGSNALSFLHTELPEERTTAKRRRLGRRLSKNVSLEEHIGMQYTSELCKKKKKKNQNRQQGEVEKSWES